MSLFRVDPSPYQAHLEQTSNNARIYAREHPRLARLIEDFLIIGCPLDAKECLKLPEHLADEILSRRLAWEG